MGQKYYAAQTGASEEEAYIAVALVSPHGFVWAAGILGLITS